MSVEGLTTHQLEKRLLRLFRIQTLANRHENSGTMTDLAAIRTELRRVLDAWLSAIGADVQLVETAAPTPAAAPIRWDGRRVRLVRAYFGQNGPPVGQLGIVVREEEHDAGSGPRPYPVVRFDTLTNLMFVAPRDAFELLPEEGRAT